MRKLQLDHGSGGLQHTRNELGDVCHKVDIQAVHSAHGPARILQVVAEGPEDRGVGVQLYLTRAVEHQIVVLSIALLSQHTQGASQQSAGLWQNALLRPVDLNLLECSTSSATSQIAMELT